MGFLIVVTSARAIIDCMVSRIIRSSASYNIFCLLYAALRTTKDRARELEIRSETSLRGNVALLHVRNYYVNSRLQQKSAAVRSEPLAAV